MNDLKRNLEYYRSTVRSCWTMLRIYIKQGDRQESIKQTVKEAKLALVEAQRIEETFKSIREDFTREIKLVA